MQNQPRPTIATMEEKTPTTVTTTMAEKVTPLDEKRISHKSTLSTSSTATNSSTSSSGSCTPLVPSKRDTFRSSIIDLEAQADLSEFQEKKLSWLRYTVINVYKRLFSLAFIGNAIAFIILVVRSGSSTSPLDLVNASAVNLCVCGLARQPLVVNSLFLLFGSLPRSSPMRLRRLCCKIFHLGGVHSGAGVASCVWYIGFASLYTYQFAHAPPTAMGIAVVALVWFVLALLVSIIVVAHPVFRMKRHDYFELTHRFSNWIILALFWALLIMLSSQDPGGMGPFLLHLPAFWIALLLTIATIHPWVLLRKVPVVPEPLSPHAVRLHFSHTTVRFGQGISVAKHPLKDWHSFASFPDRFDDTLDTKFSCLVSKAGDWTSGAIKEQPKFLWKRGIPTYGFGYVFRMFERIIVVTTGSGIGPCLSFIADDHRPLMRVVWQTKSPIKTYGQRTLDLVKRMDPDPVVIDTSVSGRVDMLPLVLSLYREFNADAVCVISNPAMTKKIVYGCESRGVPAYGPIFDS
ncbi:hypothetical protein QBC46DRAFT_321566 [Diplogelasinospora grovesii]|uniref:Integral membrane protein TmpA n=1 Tax=Diplogelasinospora grovesii TaxID=303347 RepID=A0AAN6S098_9PEZI|nr:hypothetical protein QBC46DRAFT_321566 [Diplogelasinospora grovesii]